MDAVGQAVAGQAATVASNIIWEQIVYVWDYKDNLDNLKKGIDDLKRAKARVANDVEAAKKQLEEIEEDVESWLKDVNEEISKAEQILEDDRRASNCCCVCVKNRHKFSRRAKLERLAIEGLMKRSHEFPRVGIPVPPPGLVPCEDYQSFESREGIVESILQVLKDEDVKRAGIWGLGGVGKTTLARKVQERAREKGIFYTVAFTTVGQKPNLSKIQQEIADWLNFKIHLESIEARASKLHDRLKLENKVLIILDDVWEQVVLNKIGIPSGGDTIVSKLPSGGDANLSQVSSVTSTNVCKVLLTSRNKRVLLEMEARAKDCFQLGALTEEEAWKLFRANVGDVQDPVIEPVATEITRRCAGLPVLILPVAISLRNRELYEWKEALEELKKFDGKGIKAQAFAALELSYNFLVQDQKLLFLLCGQLVGSSTSYLLRYATGMDLFQQCKPLETARNKMLKLLNDLKSSSFLLEGPESGFIRMHDVVYDFAIEVASRDHVLTKPEDGILENWPEKHMLESYTSISLLNCKIPELPMVLECPKLKTFTIASSQNIPDSCFQRMSDLKVLHLSEMDLSPWPSSFQYLESLQTLCLDRCFLGEGISMIGNLSKLKILSLAGSEFVELPSQIGQLTRLQLLDLSECRRLKVIALGVFSSLTSLEDLYMGGISVEWDVVERGSTRSNPILGELMNLPNLTTLHVQIPDVLTLSKDFFANCKLERFCIQIGDDYFCQWNAYETLNTLRVKLTKRCPSVEEVKILLNITESLHLEGLIRGIQNDLCELDAGGFSRLKLLFIKSNHEIGYIINSIRRGRCNVFPRLEYLQIENLKKLEKICNGPFFRGLEAFSNLRTLKVRGCDGLKYLFLSSWVRGLPRLESIEITECEMLEAIVKGESEDDVIEFPQLQKLKLKYLPHFASICSISSEGPSEIRCRKDVATEMSYNCSEAKTKIPNLKELELSSIKVQKIWSSRLLELYSSVTKMTRLVVEKCENLKYLFTFSIIESLAQLKSLEVRDCKLLEELILPDEIGEQVRTSRIFFPKMETLTLENLPVLVKVCTGDLVECPILEKLIIDDCPEMSTFIMHSLSHEDMNANNTRENMFSTLFDNKVLFPSLQYLTICKMHSLKMMWHEELHQDSFCKLKTLRVRNLPNLLHIWNADALGTLSLQNLQEISVSSCSSLKSLFPASITRELLQLEEIYIWWCYLEQVITGDETNDEVVSFELPRLKKLSLNFAPNLKSFYPRRHSLACPMLERLVVKGCPRLVVNVEDMQQSQPQSHFSQVLFPFDEVLSRLESLSLDSEYAQLILEHSHLLPPVLSSKLKYLELYGSKDKDESIPLKFLEWFPSMEKLEVWDCDFRELFPYRILNEEKHARTLSHIRHLELHKLYAMSNIWNADSHLHLVLQNLETLRVSHCNKLISLVPYSVSFKSLTTLEVYWCQQIVSLLTFSTAKSLVQLRTMEVKYCDNMREIVAITDGENEVQVDIIFQKLKNLTLRGLKNLTSFCPGNCTIKFPSLVTVDVRQCPNMEFFSRGILSTPKLSEARAYVVDICWKEDLNTSIGQTHSEMVGFSNMTKVVLSEYPKLKKIWDAQGHIWVNVFSNLKSLVVDDCSTCTNAIPYSLLRMLNNLEKLEVTSCDSVKELFDLEVISCDSVEEVISERSGYLSMLKELHLINLLVLRHIWNEVPKEVLDFKNLKLLKIYNCGTLKYVLSPSMVTGLPQLQELEVHRCLNMKTIVAQEIPQEATIASVVFCQLNSLTLESLPQLTSFYCGSVKPEFPYLMNINILKCPPVFTSTFLIQQPLSGSVEAIELEIFPQLEFLSLTSEDAQMLMQSQLPTVVSRKLKVLELRDFEEDHSDFPIAFLERFPHIEKVIVRDNSCKVLFPCEILNEEKHARILSRIQHLHLDDLPTMSNIWSPESYAIIQNLQTLTIRQCDNLISFPSSVYFKGLTTLNVHGCGQMVSLLASLTAKSLAQLREMEVRNCRVMRAIVADEVIDEAETEIIFDKLVTLKLVELESLENFCSKNCTLKFPSLDKVIVMQCPKMEFFSRGHLRTPKLDILWLTEDYDRAFWKVDLNTTIRKLYSKKNGRQQQ